MKPNIKNYLSITKKEWNGMVVLVILIVLVLALPYVYQLFHKDTVINPKDFDKAIALLSKDRKDSIFGETTPDQKTANPVLFDFDPNTLPLDGWEKLGLSGKQVNIIKNYLAKGGHFYKNTDVQRIYGITADDYKRLEPYIDIPGKVFISNKLQPGATIELNGADSAKLTEVKGIGPSFAMRIIRYRDRLGGFYHEEQLKDVYGVDSMKYAEIAGQLTINPALVSKIKINAISFESLRQFPYLTYKQANAIIQYRQQHGHYNSINEIKKIDIIGPADLQKIESYLSYK
jgi:competence protein ComEA